MLLKAWLLVIFLNGNIHTEVFYVERECTRAAQILDGTKNVRARCVPKTTTSLNVGPVENS